MRATLRADVTAFLLEHGPSSALEVELGVRARRHDIRSLLASEGFCEVDRPEGASPRARFFYLSQLVQRTPRGKSRAALMLAVLSDGKRHSRDEIFRKAGRFFLTNNAAAELRKAGYGIRSGYEGENVVVYWLDSPSAKPLAAAAGASISGSAREAAAA